MKPKDRLGLADASPSEGDEKCTIIFHRGERDPDRPTHYKIESEILPTEQWQEFARSVGAGDIFAVLHARSAEDCEAMAIDMVKGLRVTRVDPKLRREFTKAEDEVLHRTFVARTVQATAMHTYNRLHGA